MKRGSKGFLQRNHKNPPKASSSALKCRVCSDAFSTGGFLGCQKCRHKWRGFRPDIFVHKKKVILVIIILAILGIAFGAKIALFVNFLLGNDIVVKVHASEEWVELAHGENQTLTFDASVTTNPFCKALCTSVFEDVGHDVVVEEDSFTLRPALPLRKEYVVQPPEQGTGIDLYRFSLECTSVSTLLCHTNQQPTTRSLMILVEYGLTEEEQELKEDLQHELQTINDRLYYVYGQEAAFQSLAEVLSINLENLTTTLVEAQQGMRRVEGLWEQQDYISLVEEVQAVQDRVSQVESSAQIINTTISNEVQRQNSFAQNLSSIRNSLFIIRDSTLPASVDLTFNSTAALFNAIIASGKWNESIIAALSNQTNFLASQSTSEVRMETLRYELERDILSDTLCMLIADCPSHPPLQDRAIQTQFNFSTACTELDTLKQYIVDVNASLRNAFLAQAYPNATSFWENITLMVSNARSTTITTYLQTLPAGNNTPLIRTFLEPPVVEETTFFPGYNLTPALAAELIKTLSISCSFADFALPLAEINYTPLTMPEIIPLPINFSFTDPEPQCCIFGDCSNCCSTPACQNDPATYPVVFLHGHAVSKETSADYSLEGFNQIQERLEEEGYLNAGAITLYTSRNIPPGSWGKLNVPLALRASYYFDLFEEPENYVVVPTKSENIDTYAIRLKDLIDTIKYKTGKPKVNLVAFSMGGLVARRYLQVFGSDNVNMLIMIGTPNKGIVGDVAEYCPLVGEQRECRDMHAESIFMKKLNTGKLPYVPIHNIVGTGCEMNGEQGDGAVLERNAYLEGAQNYIINGTCEGVAEPLHLALRDIETYPEVYEIITEALQGER